MQFLITGGAGFIGTALANFLISQGHAVRVLDDLSAGDPARLDPSVTFSRGDVRDVPKLWSLLRGIDCVYHLAARVSVPESLLYPVEYNSVNVGGTVALMTAMRDAGVRRVILTSSGAAYGESGHQPVQETDVMHPTSPYAVSKLASEYYVRSIGELWKIEAVALRIFNAYGPNQPLPPFHAPAIPRFMRQALTGGSVVIFGNGKQSRDFLYIDDVVRALYTAATATRVSQRVINVGSGVEVSINQLVDAIESATGRQIHRIINQEEPGGVSRLVADISLARELLDWSPRASLQEGLAAMLQNDQRFQTRGRVDGF